MRRLTPRTASSHASVSPVGPAPTIKNLNIALLAIPHGALTSAVELHSGTRSLGPQARRRHEGKDRLWWACSEPEDKADHGGRGPARLTMVVSRPDSAFTGRMSIPSLPQWAHGVVVRRREGCSDGSTRRLPQSFYSASRECAVPVPLPDYRPTRGISWPTRQVSAGPPTHGNSLTTGRSHRRSTAVATCRHRGSDVLPVLASNFDQRWTSPRWYPFAFRQRSPQSERANVPGSDALDAAESAATRLLILGGDTPPVAPERSF
jgi:hypothetical protein